MATIQEALDSIKDEGLKLIKDQLKDLLTSAQNDTDAKIKETGKKIGDWLVLRAKGELSDQEFEALLYSRDQLLRQYKNTLEIAAKARLEKIAIGLLNLVLDKILGFAFKA